MFLWIACLPLVAAGCKTLDLPFQKEKEEPVPTMSAKPMMIPIGTVSHVDANAGFVLIQSRRALEIEPETVIQIYNSSGVLSATAKVSPARKGQFLTADLIQGMPVKGDQAITQMSPLTPNSEVGMPEGAPGIDSDIQVLE